MFVKEKEGMEKEEKREGKASEEIFIKGPPKKSMLIKKDPRTDFLHHTCQ